MITPRTRRIVLSMLNHQREEARMHAAHLSRQATFAATVQPPAIKKLRMQNAILGRAIAEIEAMPVRESTA